MRDPHRQGAQKFAMAREGDRASSAAWIFVIGEELELETVRRECLPGEPQPVSRRFESAAAALEALENFEPPPECREVIVAVPAGAHQRLEALSEALERLPVPASLALHGLSFGEARATPSFVVLSTGPATAGGFDYVFSKRLVDLAISAMALVILAPVFLVISAITWWRSGRPVLLAQERVGRGGRRFRLHKFRTLPVESLADEDHRWTPGPTDEWGRFLRDTGLDELPQLYNVLRGDMSLVGPRPERPHFVEQFRRQLPFYSTRHRFQVGITGWAQVHGWRGDTSIARRVEHDLYYLRNRSLALDLRILGMTLSDFSRQLRAAALRARSAKVPDARSV